MPSGIHDHNIAQNMRTIEWLKAELISDLGSLYRAMVGNAEDLILDSLASLVIGCYFLGKRLGVSFQKLDSAITEKLSAKSLQEHEIEEWYGDVTNLQQYLKERNRNGR